MNMNFMAGSGTAEISRLDNGIECRLTVCVAPQQDLEVRRCRLTNSSDRSRRIELTSYVEWMLCSPEADASHPVFSKLFVETQFCSDRRAILARRRPRHSDESEFWGLHTIVCDDLGPSARPVQFETNRLRFIGRGRTLASPLALERGAGLSGDCGPMLDPIASLRVEVALGPGESSRNRICAGRRAIARPDR